MITIFKIFWKRTQLLHLDHQSSFITASQLHPPEQFQAALALCSTAPAASSRNSWSTSSI